MFVSSGFFTTFGMNFKLTHLLIITTMANKRDLKRGINYICSELFAECIATSIYSNNSDRNNMDTLLKSVMRMHSDYIMRVSHPEPGMKAKKYYNALIQSFNNDVNEIVDQISNLHS